MDAQAELSKLLGGGFSADGWAGLEPQDDVNQNNTEERFLKAKEVADAFLTPAGKVCLQRLREATYLNASWLVDRQGLLDAVGYGIFREGQNSLVRWIDLCIKTAQEGPATPKKKPRSSR